MGLGLSVLVRVAITSVRLSRTLRGSASVLKMLHQCNIGYGCAIAINLVVVRVQRRLCYGFVFEKKAKSVTFSI